jgi:hypothetical protein
MSGRTIGSDPSSPLEGERAPSKDFPQGFPQAFVVNSEFI